jgi:hypothetical protein
MSTPESLPCSADAIMMVGIRSMYMHSTSDKGAYPSMRPTVHAGPACTCVSLECYAA